MRRSKNITKPLHEVLMKQNLWQANQLSAYKNNEPSREDPDFQNSSDVPQTTEKSIESAAMVVKYPGYHCEVTSPREPHIIQKRSGSNYEDMATTLTQYHDDQVHNGGGDIGQSYIEPKDVYVGTHYETNGSEMEEYRYPKRVSSYNRKTNEKAENCKLINLKEQHKNNLSGSGQSYKLTQFKGVLKKVKQGCCTHNLNTTYQPLNISYSSMPTEHSSEKKKEYIRSILNGIPINNHKAYNSPFNENNSNKTNKSQNKLTDLNKPHGYPSNEQDESTFGLKPKNNLMKNESAQMDTSPCMKGKDSTVLDNHTHMSNMEDFQSCNYNLRNGVNQSSPGNSKFVVNNQNLNGNTESQRNKQSYNLTNGFISDNEYASEEKPIKSEHPVYKNCFFTINKSLNSDKKTVQSKNDIEQKSASEKIINNNNNSSIFSKDIPKDYYDVKSHKNNTEVESALKNESISSTSKHSKLNETENKVNCYQIESYYQSDRQSKVSDKIKPNDKFSAETNKITEILELENLKQYIPKSTKNKFQRKNENYEQNKHPSDIDVKSSSFKPQLNSQDKNNNVVINSTLSKLKTNPLQQELAIINNNEANSNNFKLNCKNEVVLRNKVNNNAENIKVKTKDLKQKMKAYNSILINNKYKLTSQNSPKSKITLGKSQDTKDKIQITKDKTQVLSKKLGEKEINEDISVKKMLAPILPITNGFEIGNKSNSKPGSKEELSKNVDNINTELKPALIKEGTALTGINDFILGKCEAAQSKIGNGSFNNIKSDDSQNNINKKIEPQLNISASASDIKTSGKSTAVALHLIKKDVAGKEGKITHVSSLKPVELKWNTSLIKLNKEKDNSISLSKTVEKLAAMLKEHRMLLELLFEKLNCRVVSYQGDTKIDYRNIQTNEGLDKPDKSSYDTDVSDKAFIQFKEVFNKRMHSGEKLRRVKPENNSQSKIKETEITNTKVPTKQDERRIANLLAEKPLQRFQKTTMMISPSGRQLQKESVIDGSKLANYNFSPLKQILSQYNIDLPTKLPRQSQSSIFEHSPGYNKNKIFNYQIRGKRIYVPTKLPNNTSFTYPVKKHNKSKENYSQIKKIAMVNKKKNYNIRYNKKHLILKNLNRINTLNTVSKVVKSSKKYAALEKKDKTIDNKDQLISNKKKKGNAISKGPILDFANGNQKKPQKLTWVTKEPIIVKSSSLLNAKQNFTTRSSSHSKTSDSLENKFTVFNSEYSDMLNGPTWVSSPEFNDYKIQWNLPSSTTSTNNEKNRMNIKEGDNIDPVNSNLLHSGTNNVLLPKVVPFTSKGAIPKQSFRPVLQSSSLPLIISLSKSRSLNKSNIYSSKTVGIKNISNHNIGKFKNEIAKSKLHRNLSCPIRTYVPSVTKEKNINKFINVPYRTIHDTATKKSKKSEHANLGLHKKKHSLDARNNLLFSRNETPSILTTMKPSLLSFRTISHKDSTPTSKGGITLKEQQELNMLPFKDPSIKTVINDRYLKLLHQVYNLKTTWVKISDKVKSMVENKTGVKGSCKPNFDAIMASTNEDRESICQKDPRHLSKQTQSKHLLANTTEKKISRNLKYQGKKKKVIISNFLNSGVKNF